MYYEKGLIGKIEYNEYLNKLSADLKLLDKLFLLTATTNEIMKRDYQSAIYLEKRSKTNEENIGNLAKAYENLGKIIISSYENMTTIDTTNINPRDTSIIIVEESMNSYQKKLEQKH